MADETNNKASLEFEARVNEASFEAAEKRAGDSTKRVAADAKASAAATEREARNTRRLTETNQQEETAVLRAQQRERDRIRREAASIAKSTLNDEARAFTDHINKENRQRREASALAKSTFNDEARAFAEKTKREAAQLREAAQIRKAMRADELRETERQRSADARLAADRRRFDRESRERQVFTRAQMASFQGGADKLLGMLGGGHPGGPPGRGGPPGAGGKGWGGGQGIDPFLTSFGFGLGATGAPGSRLLGTLALGQGFGGREGLYGGIAGGAVAVAAVVAIKSIKDALENTAAEQKFAGAILQIGGNFEKSKNAADAFKTSLSASRAESNAIAAAFAQISTRIETKPGDVTAISARANATGQTPDDLAKTLQAIAQGSKDAFESQTGLQATITVNEYARSIGKLPSALTEAQKAQALYNKFVLQGANYQELANAKLNSAEGRINKFKANITDLSAEFGNALITTFTPGPSSAYLANPFTYYQNNFKRMQDEADKLANAQRSPVIQTQLDEQKRQRDLETRYESVSKQGETGLKARQREKPGETAAERLRETIAFREEFEALLGGLDQADPRIKSISESIEQDLAKAAGRAYSEIEQLRKGLSSVVGEFAGLQLSGQNNPFVQLYTEAALASDDAAKRFRMYGEDVVAQFALMKLAAIDSQIYQVRVQSTMRATSLEFEAARLSKPFIELTGEMKRSLSVLQSEIGAAITVPKMLASAAAIDLFASSRTPGNREEAFGRRGVSEVGGEFVMQQQFNRLRGLQSKYAGEGGIGGAEIQHLLDQEFIKIFQAMPPALQGQALRAPGGQFARVFSGAYRGEAGYAESQVELSLKRAVIGRQSVQEAQGKLKELRQLAVSPDAQRAEITAMAKSLGMQLSAKELEERVKSGVDKKGGALRAEILAITGALPREELTPELLKGRIEALKEEAVFQRQSQEAAIKAVQQGAELYAMLDGRLEELKTSILNREESVLLKILDDSDRTRISTLGPAMDAKSEMTGAMNLGGLGGSNR